MARDPLVPFGLVAAVFFLLAACSLVGVRGSHAIGPVTITPDAAGRTIELRTDQELLVRLPSNPATGYRWSLAAAPADVLRLEGLPAFERNAGSTGGSGVEIWRFTLARKGQQVLRFDYRLPWEADSPPAQQLSFIVTVR